MPEPGEISLILEGQVDGRVSGDSANVNVSIRPAVAYEDEIEATRALYSNKYDMGSNVSGASVVRVWCECGASVVRVPFHRRTCEMVEFKGSAPKVLVHSLLEM